MQTKTIERLIGGPASVRDHLLFTAAEEIHRHGYQGARVDRIIAAAGTTKGAFYHHFSSKLQLGYAVVDECLARAMDTIWITPLNLAVDPANAFRSILEAQLEYAPSLATLGDPIANLGQEMSPIDEGFRLRIDRILGVWREAMEIC